MLKMNNFKMFFYFMLILSSVLIIFSNYWMNMWIWLEINMISFIMLMINNKNYNSIESSLIYFLIQTIASIMMICSIIFSLMFMYLYIFIIISLMLKLSVAPLHFWLPMMIEGMNWMLILMLLTWQKINPLIILNLYYYYNYLFMFIIISAVISSLMGLNYSSLKKIMTYSSINQMSWIILSMMMMNKIFKLYMLIYFFLMLMIIYSFYVNNLFFLHQMFTIKMNKFINLFIFCNLLSLGGLPPFLGFFPKMMLMNYMNYMLMFILIMLTLITLFFYIRIIISMMLLNSNKMNNNYFMKNNLLNKKLIIITYINNLLLLFILLIY